MEQRQFLVLQSFLISSQYHFFSETLAESNISVIFSYVASILVHLHQCIKLPNLLNI